MENLLHCSWYAAYVRSCQERIVRDQLARRENFEAYVPEHLVTSKRRDRKVMLNKVLVPSYVFFRCPPELPGTARRISEVVYVLRNPGEGKGYATVSDDEIERLKKICKDGPERVEFEFGKHPVGTKVRIVKGSLEGVEGEVARVSESDHFLYLQVGGLGYAKVRVDRSEIEVIGPPDASTESFL